MMETPPPPPPPPVDGPPPPELEPPPPPVEASPSPTPEPPATPPPGQPPARGRSRPAALVAIVAVVVIALIVGIAASRNGGPSGSQTEPTGPVIVPGTDVPSDVPSTAVPTTTGSACLASVPGTQVDIGLIHPVIVVVPGGWVQQGTSGSFNYSNQWTAAISSQPGLSTDNAADDLNVMGFTAKPLNPPTGSRVLSEGYDAQAGVLMAVRDDGEKLIITTIPLTPDAAAADRTIVSHLLASVVVTFGCPSA